MLLKKWIRNWFLIVLFSIMFIGVFNYTVDPYDIYDNKLLKIYKTKKHDKIRLVKAIEVREKNIKTIVLGTSRATYGYNPEHKYFEQPAYNAAIPGGTMYENLLYLKESVKDNTLKNVFLVLDYRMFNSRKQKRISDFESYFYDKYLKYKYLLSYSQFKDSLSTLKKKDNIKIYLKNGFRQENISTSKRENQYEFMLDDESTYYKNTPVNYLYKDTQNSSMNDFSELLDIVGRHNLKLTIIFGPSHIRLWESLDYYLDYSLWLKWKKDIVLKTNDILGKNSLIYDFSIYNKYTNEEIPIGNKEMKYFIDTNHYKESLGKLVLDYLNNDFNEESLAVRLTPDNIDLHLEKLSQDRLKYIDVANYKKIMDKYINNK